MTHFYQPRIAMAPRTSSRDLHRAFPLASPVAQSEVQPSGTTPKDADVVQFLSKVFFAYEDDGVVSISVVRIGSLKGSRRIHWRTQDSSAKKDLKYIHGEDVIDFGPGESVRTFEITIISDDHFDTALDFDVILEDPEGCMLDPRLHVSRVLIIDDDQFPSNDFEEAIAEKSEAALLEVGFSLLWAFVCFCFSHVPTIKWKSILYLVLANLGNAYYLATIFMRVYLIDTVLNVKDSETEKKLWIPGDRTGTAMALGLAWVLPNVVLLAVDFFEMAVLEMGFNIRYHLRVNLFRKYLRYTDESRALVPVQALKISIMEDIPDLVSQGYLILFELWAMLGKIAMVAIFILQELPRSAVPLVVYPVLIIVHLIRTHRTRMELMAKEGDGKSATIECLMQANHGYKLLKAYGKLTTDVRHFEILLHNQRKFVMDLKSFNFWNAQLIPWITTLVIGFYIGASYHLVSSGHVSLGALVQTINVVKDLGDRFSTLLSGVEELSKAVSPLSSITFQFNLETETLHRADVFATKKNYALNFSSAAPNFDNIPIVFQNVKIDHSLPDVHNVEFSTHILQGTVIQIIGPHDSGKGQLLKKICGPGAAENILMSPHLFALQVPHEPLFLESHGLFENLHLVSAADRHCDVKSAERGLRILKRLKLDKDWIIRQHEVDASSFTGRIHSLQELDRSKTTLQTLHVSCCDDEEQIDVEAEEGYQAWFSQMSGSEKWRFQLARAFVADPHVLIVHRPVDELDDDLKEVILPLLREFVDKRGLEIDEDARWTLRQRRPRTVIFSTGSIKTSIADYIWRISEEGVTSVEKTHRPKTLKRVPSLG